MQDFLKVTGMVIKVFPQGDYNRRIVLLTREHGKITAFVNGARKQGSRFAASTDLFVFGTFELYVGKDAYNVQNAEILNYFEFLRTDMEAAYYGMYFLELSDYYAREENDEALLLLCVYRALQGLKVKGLSNSLVKEVFETKLFIIEGEMIPTSSDGGFTKEFLDALSFYEECSIEDLYKYPVDDSVLNQLISFNKYQRKHLIDKKLNSLEILETMVF